MLQRNYFTICQSALSSWCNIATNRSLLIVCVRRGKDIAMAKKNNNGIALHPIILTTDKYEFEIKPILNCENSDYN